GLRDLRLIEALHQIADLLGTLRHTGKRASLQHRATENRAKPSEHRGGEARRGMIALRDPQQTDALRQVVERRARLVDRAWVEAGPLGRPAFGLVVAMAAV